MPRTFRDRFCDFEGVTYLDVASQGPLPRAAGEAARAAVAIKERPYRIVDTSYFDAPRAVRAEAAQLFHAPASAIAITTGAGAAVNAVARGLEWRAGDEIVLPALEFPSNRYPWLALAARGVEVVEVASDHPSGAVSAARLAEHVGPRTRLVAFALVSYVHGARIDPAPVVAAAARAGALTLCDASQAAGAMPIDFIASGIDVLTMAAYKTLLAPYGTALALFSDRALGELGPSDIVWWSVEGSENFNRLPGADFRLRADATRFDAHEPASFIQLAALEASLRLFNEIGPDAASAHARALGDRLVAGLPAAFTVASPTEAPARSHIVCLAGPNVVDVRARLEAQRIRVSVRSDMLRVSPYLYNDEADVDRLLAALAS